ncbi:16S rRNA (uracil(1498)-N(3))-methyltransferase [Alteribacter natronophilus]|uniref:16S rRNA (uracil(1498)-N(3))-methyltransferase n=1 Tax=Alteribacter natronophilus TaxID=2583810 RepID=UPI00110E8C98|nr:16S rRNA (uracil(1498)-N(3))-methyltransferase [Alteribacter natronophilus]TMW73866.1 16S rRNA (uracil(1498)-N(3))-methyltransferase [Alteribacter natronophilus]
MQRYFLDDAQFQHDGVIMTGDEAKHTAKVMRMSEGDEVVCCNRSGTCFRVRLTSVSAERTEGTVLEREARSAELPVHVTIACGLPKADKLELVIQKGTELGAAEFIPFEAERSVVKLNAGKVQKKLERWTKIAQEAAEQSHRSRVPSVREVMTFKQLVSLVSEYDSVVAAYEEEARNDEKSRLSQVLNETDPGSRILVIAGPEGGFSDREIEDLTRAKAVSCALGPRILRAETAPLYALSAISYHFELSR